MYVNNTGNMTEARQQAQHKANFTNEPWVIFKCAAGNMHVERQRLGPSDSIVIEVVHPLRQQINGHQG